MIDYVSKPDGITAADMREILSDAQAGEVFELVRMADGHTTPIVTAMLSEDGQSIYLYTEIA